ncbi:MAG: sulfatase-like hydrolase/transferase [Candidatus Aminicenantes bacterium]|nr:sulfatase-like hydrolase/transferase [Candidatus Aminicenantes bacterium]
MKFPIFFTILLLILTSTPDISYSLEKKTSKLNLLLITIDTLRTDRLSCYNRTHLITPAIDSLASQGVIFMRAFSHTSTTLPSHTNILTGLTPNYHGVHENSNFIVSEEITTMAEFLKDQGYSTGAFVGAYPLDSRFGLAQGFDIYDDHYGSQSARKNKYYIERTAEEVVDLALDWVKKQKAPWFLWVHCFDPHFPYEPPEPFLSQYESDPYSGEVAYVDSVLKQITDFTLTGEVKNNTIIIFTGDHAESLNEHGEPTHAYFAYNSSIWIPLIISAPDISARKVTEYVSHTDIFPTVCDLLDLKKPAILQGNSLLPLLKGKKFKENPIYFESLYPYYSRGWAPLRGYIFKEKKYIESPIPELYDLKTDFDELKNLAEDKKMEDFQKKLASLMKSQTSSIAINAKGKMDKETLEKLRSLGYISTGTHEPKKTFGPKDDIKINLPNHNKAMAAMDEFRKGNSSQAVQMLKEIITERSDIDVAFTNLATIYKESNMLKEAILVLEQGLESLPNNFEIFKTYLNFLTNAGLSDKLIEAFKNTDLREKEFMPEIWNYLGIAYFNKGDLKQAEAAYLQGLSIDNKYASIYTNLGLLYLSDYLRTKKIESHNYSVESFKKAVEYNPEDAHAFNGLGGAYLAYSNPTSAIENFKKALELRPEYDQALYNLGRAYLTIGDKENSRKYLLLFKKLYYPRLSGTEKKKFDELLATANK